jgi:hypothetical protein
MVGFNKLIEHNSKGSKRSDHELNMCKDVLLSYMSSLSNSCIKVDPI